MASVATEHMEAAVVHMDAAVMHMEAPHGAHGMLQGKALTCTKKAATCAARTHASPTLAARSIAPLSVHAWQAHSSAHARRTAAARALDELLPWPVRGHMERRCRPRGKIVGQLSCFPCSSAWHEAPRASGSWRSGCDEPGLLLLLQLGGGRVGAQAMQRCSMGPGCRALMRPCNWDSKSG